MMHTTATKLSRLVGLVLLPLAGAGCDEVLLTDQVLEIGATGSVEGLAYFDADGSEDQSGGDTPYAGLRLRLTTAGGGTVTTAITDPLGRFSMEFVPVGAFRIALDEATAPDSVAVFGLDDPLPFVVAAGTSHSVLIRVAFSTFGLAEVRALPPGQRVVTHGIALNPRNSFGDGVVHLQEGSVYLRATEVERSGLSVGDSVRFVGITARDEGQPILTDVRAVILVDDAVLVDPVSVSTAAARTAAGGTLDAALVRITNAAVLDTVRVGGHLTVTADDGSGPVDLVLRDFIGFDARPFKPNVATLVEAVGLLVPVQVGQGQTRWRMTPRFTDDLEVDDGTP
jgi:hypothetical protein